LFGIWNFAKAQDDVEQVDAESVLWQILELNKVTEVSMDVTVDQYQCYGHGKAIEANFKFVPWSKTPLLDEPIVNNEHWNINGQLYYPGVDVKDLLIFIAKEHIKTEHRLENYDMYNYIDCTDGTIDLVVTFITKHRRIWVDQVEV